MNDKSACIGSFKTGLEKCFFNEIREGKDRGLCVVLPKRKFLSISVHIICSVRAENEVWEEEERNPSEDLTRLSDGARGLHMNNT